MKERGIGIIQGEKYLDNIDLKKYFETTADKTLMLTLKMHLDEKNISIIYFLPDLFNGPLSKEMTIIPSMIERQDGINVTVIDFKIVLIPK